MRKILFLFLLLFPSIVCTQGYRVTPDSLSVKVLFVLPALDDSSSLIDLQTVSSFGGSNTIRFTDNGVAKGSLGSGSGFISLNTGVNGFLLKLGTYNTDRLIIDSTGRVGIGMTPVTEKLEVNGNIKIGNATIRSGTGSPESAVTGSIGDLFLRTNGGANTTLYVKESGNGTNTG